MYPWPSIGGFLFKREEHIIFGTDSGWISSPNYQRSRPLGTATDVIITLSIGSKERTFEVNLSLTRYNQLEAMLNTTALFTDWARPIPDSRQAFVASVTISDPELASYKPTGIYGRKIRTKITLVTQ